MNKRNQELFRLMEHPLGPNDEFKFRCEQCGGCCKKRNDILLSPFDICRIAQETGEEIADVVEHYGLLFVGHDSKMPLVSLRMNERNGNCLFLKEDNRCRIQKNKPTICALFPLGRCAKRDAKTKTTEIFYILQPTHCGKRDETHTPKEWMGSFNLSESEKWFTVWQDVFAQISEYTRAILPTVSESLGNKLMNSIANIIYLRYDLNKPLIPQVKENGAFLLKMLQDIQQTLDIFRNR